MATDSNPLRSRGIEKLLEMPGNDVDQCSSAGSKKSRNIGLSHGCLSHQSVKNSVPEKELIAAHREGLAHRRNAII
jgi:hypothetical protein